MKILAYNDIEAFYNVNDGKEEDDRNDDSEEENPLISIPMPAPSLLQNVTSPSPYISPSINMSPSIIFASPSFLNTISPSPAMQFQSPSPQGQYGQYDQNSGILQEPVFPTPNGIEKVFSPVMAPVASPMFSPIETIGGPSPSVANVTPSFLDTLSPAMFQSPSPQGQNNIIEIPSPNFAPVMSPLKKIPSNTLPNERRLREHEYIQSKNGLYRLYFIHKDLYLIHLPSNTVRWSTKAIIPNTMQGAIPSGAFLGKFGNLRLLDTKNRTYWNTNTINKGTAPYRIVLENNGHIFLYDANNTVIWSSEKKNCEYTWNEWSACITEKDGKQIQKKTPNITVIGRNGGILCPKPQTQSCSQ